MEASDTSVHLELDARKFMSQIDRWSPAGLPFKVCMQNTLFLMTLWNEGTSLIRELAVEFECSPHSVLRWANGTETPHFTLQRRIVASLHRELDLALSPASAAS